jgi:malonyl-CoA O-methyltransferase
MPSAGFNMPRNEADNAFHLDRPSVRESFDRASARYEAAARLQAQIGDELLDRLAFFKLKPQVALDLGAGTGRAAAKLKRAYPASTVVALDFAPGMLREAQRYLTDDAVRFERVCADALRLPFANASADLIFSNLMLQWCDLLDVAFAEVRRVLKPGGLFMFSTFGPDTLKELRTAWAAADVGAHVNRFIDMHDVGDALMRAGFAEPVLDVERLRMGYPEVNALMRDLKAIGAHNAALGRARGLTGKTRYQRMSEAYETLRQDGELPASYEVIYGAAWGTAGKAGSSPLEGEARIPVHAIRRRHA